MYPKTVISVWAAYSKDNNLRAKSSSGGIFSVLASIIIQNGGVVYGVCMTDDCREAVYLRVTKVEDLEKVMKSKYIQAKVGNTFKNVKRDLETGLTVLFTGTGCQVNGLKAYLQVEYSGLYCIDVICHGVPSAKLWDKYVSYVEEQNKAKLTGVDFRCKDISWVEFGIKRINSRHRKKFVPLEQDVYMNMFLKNYSLRPSCYACAAKNNKCGDFTLGDFWGIDDVAPDMNDNKGVSLVIIRTIKGEKLFSLIKTKVNVKKVSYTDAVNSNPSEYMSVERPFERDNFYIDMNQMNFYKFSKKYVSITFKKRIKIMLKKTSFQKLIGGVNDNCYGILYVLSK